MVEVKCEYCGKIIERIPARLKLNKLQFCNAECYSKYVSKYYRGRNHPHWKEDSHIKLECLNCGKIYDEIIQRKDRSHFCSNKCKYEWQSSELVGDKRYNWKGGYIPYYGTNWIEIRKRALKRDNFTCQLCGKHEDEFDISLDIHHKISIRKFKEPEDSNFLNNLITLCRRCHMKVERGDELL